MTRDTDPQLAALARRFPGWEIWRGAITGMYFGRAAGAYLPLSADTPAKLAELIGQAESGE